MLYIKNINRNILFDFETSHHPIHKKDLLDNILNTLRPIKTKNKRNEWYEMNKLDVDYIVHLYIHIVNEFSTNGYALKINVEKLEDDLIEWLYNNSIKTSY